MEHVISVVTGDLVGRFISFLANKYHSGHTYPEEKQLARLQQLLLRARTVVEEADGRYIINSGMLAQLNMLAEAMYRGYWALGVSGYRSLKESTPLEEEEVSNSSHPKHFRTVDGGARKNKGIDLVDLQGALGSLEHVVSSMTEFVVLLGGCQRMLRRPYDAYIYNDNIMFGRHVEKQKHLNFMLQHSSPSGVPAVLPIIGAPAVGKRTLVAHVCRDERVSSHFSSILHLNGDSLCRIADHGSLLSDRILLVVELSDVDEDSWAKFCSIVATLDRESKVIVISRIKNSEQLGTVNPIFLNTLPYEEFCYLFKTLAFGSVDPSQHPRLARIADELARELQSDWSLTTANLFADLMRMNMNVHFWLSMLCGLRRVVESISTGVPDSPSQTDLGAGVKFGLTPALSIKGRRRFEPNRSAGNPVPAPSRRAPIGRAGASRHVGRRESAPPGSQTTRPVALKTTRGGRSSASMAACSESEAGADLLPPSAFHGASGAAATEASAPSANTAAYGGGELALRLFRLHRRPAALLASPLWRRRHPRRPSRHGVRSVSARGAGEEGGEGGGGVASTRPSASPPPLKKVKKEEAAAQTPPLKKVKKEEAAAQTPPEKSWWVVEAEALAAVAAAGGNPEEFPGEHLIRSRSVNEDYGQVTLDDRQAELWSAMDSGAVVDLAGPSELPAPKEEEDSFDLYAAADNDDGGDDADSLDWSAFDNRRR